MIEDLVNGLVSWSEQFIVPDWGQLVALIPLGLAALVFLYVTWTVYRFATAGPTRRGRRRLAPAAPEGIHMPGPSFAPLLAAAGTFFLVFGMVANGIWLVVGVAILALTLLYWGREEMRNFDRATSGGHGGGTAAMGALAAPVGIPPAGVHMPPPSFRPLLMSVAVTMLVAGMVVGGWALLLGFLAVVVTGLGWLRDARREYAATETADRTGHLDLGGAPGWPTSTFAVLALLVAFAVLLSSGLIGGGSTGGTATASGAPGASAPAGGGAPASAAPASAAPQADVVITAKGTAWVEPDVTIPGGKPFTLAFDNQDANTPHNVVIYDASGGEVFKTDTTTGPLVKVYDVPAIPAGQYTFVCTVHANMTGTVTAS
jgi:plastocyanin